MTEHEPLHDDDIPVTEALVHQLLAEQFPEWAGLPLRRVRSSGTVNAIFRLGDDLVVRLPRAESEVWNLDTLDASHRWLGWAGERLPLTIPEPVAVGEPSTAYPWPWPVHRWIEGVALDTLDLGRSEDAAERLAAFVRALHALPGADGARRSPKAISRQAWDPEFRRLIADLGDLVDIDRATEAWELTMDAPSWTGPSVWGHSDLLPGNLLARDGELVAVVDFECLGAGEPALDVTAAWTVFDRPAREVFRRALDADEPTWSRAANLALRFVAGIRYYERTNPTFSAMALRAVTEVLDDLAPARRSSAR